MSNPGTSTRTVNLAATGRAAAVAVITAALGVSALHPATAAPNTTKSGTEYVWATKANANEIHRKARGRSCPDDFTLARAKGTHKVTWQYPKRLGEKTLKKGKFACIYTSTDGVTSQGKFDKNGVLTALPSNFPKNPTPADIASLGLTPDMKVSPNLRMPQPKAGTELAPAVLPEKVTVVATHPNKIIEVSVPAQGYNDFLNGGQWVETRPATVERLFPVEIEYHGGEGVVMVASAYDPSTDQLVPYKGYKLSPDKVTKVYQMFGVPDSAPSRVSVVPQDGGTASSYFHVGGFIAPDYGQANLPATMLSDWKGYEEEGGIWERRARTPNQPKQSSMVNLGQWANSGRAVSGEPKDGFAWISNLGNILDAGGGKVPNHSRSVLGDTGVPWQ